MTFTILYPDAKPAELDIETRAVGNDVKLIHARQDAFEAIERSVWQSCDAVVVSRMPIDANVISLLERCRIIVRNGVGFDVLGQAFGLLPAGQDVSADLQFSNWSPEITVSYKPTEQLMVYDARLVY